MGPELRAELEKYVDNCEKNGLTLVCEKVATPEGKEYIISRLNDMMDAYPTWSAEECLTHIEVELNDLKYY